MMLVAMAVTLQTVWRAQSPGGSVVLGALEAAFVGMLMSCIFGDVLWTKGFWLTLTLLTWAINSEKQAAGMSGASMRHG
jgi:hypothetical protein